jgi:type IV pilus assembly protein PilY1
MRPFHMRKTTRTVVGFGARCIALGVLAAATPAFGALTDISNNPLSSATSVAVKPNVLFLLDNSGSMAWSHMPDSMGSFTSAAGYRNFQCNVIYYNPSIRYVPPKNPDGTDMANSSFTAAKDDGYSSTSTTTNLSTSFKAFNASLSPSDNNGGGTDTAQAAYYWLYSGTATVAPSTGVCTNVPVSQTTTTTFTASPSGTWNKVVVSATSGPGASDERQNFANWYTYYRRRIEMMKGTGSRSFNQLSSSYRVGFMLLNPYSSSFVTGSDFVPVTDFDTTQRNTWFSTLFKTTVNSSTPLRLALSRAGRYYAHQTGGVNSGITDDPMQYSCQQNFTLVVTDGYWNGSGGVKLDGTTAMDNEDGNAAITPRPLYDGSTTTTTITTTLKNQFYDNTGCSSGRTRIRETDTVTTEVKTFDGSGNVVSDTTSTSSSTINVTSCRSSPGPLQSPNPQTTTTNVTSTGTGGSIGSLADVAAYYYNTDLRPAGSLGAPVGSPAVQNDVGTDNNVPANGTFPEGDTATWQHMTTFTMGLGLNGTLAYSPSYKTDTTGDFASIRAGTLNWPVPVADAPTALDDLWHAAVNGRGQFFSASDPDSVIQGLNTALSGINARTASAAAAATSNLQPVAGDNFAYIAKFETVSWTGELEAHQIDLTTGQVLAPVVWSAQTKLDAQVNDACDNRTIWLFRSGATSNLTHFSWNTFRCDLTPGSPTFGLPTGTADTGLNLSEQAYFGATIGTTPQFSSVTQYISMTDGTAGTVNQKAQAVGANLVNFLRGQRQNEIFIPNTSQFYRERNHVLGDIVDAQPIFVKAPFASYNDTGYAAFATANANRTPMVYVAANDGMLHAFFAGTSTTDPNGGVEAWAFMPSSVLPNLYKLSDNNYGNLHIFSVDGTPTAGDFFDTTAGVWKTMIVGGLNAGGKSYYALDITDPANPKGMWEFKYSTTCFDSTNSATWSADCNLGLSFGNPVITKLRDGTWVVLITSGYNNVDSTAPNTNDGKGFLYVLEAKSGKILFKIGTGVGTAATPSGLSKINNWVDDTIHDNTTQRVYGVDLLGNVWRFDVNDIIDPPGREASLLATTKDANGVPQPITTRPELAEVGSPPNPFVYVGTGRYLGTSDIPANATVTQQTQSVYAIRDPLTATPWPDLRAALRHMVITDVGSGATETRTVSCPSATGNCTSTDGWFADFPDNGERVNVDPKLQLGTLVVATNIPLNTACTVGGSSFINFFDFATGGAVSTSPGGIVGMKLSSSLAVGLNVVRLPSGKTVVIATTSDAQQKTIDAPIGTPSPTGKRISWRELMQ